MVDVLKNSKRRRARHCQWYIAARYNNAHTNEVIAVFLAGKTDIAEEGVRCADGIPRNLWLCTFGDVQAFLHSRGHAQIQFEILRKCDGERYPRLAPKFLTHNKKVARRASERLQRPKGAQSATAP
ncbi:MAG: hypothetical protein AAB372_00970 [Patescibacteria group bacterium]